MTAIHATAVGVPDIPGNCTWMYHHEDVDLHCTEKAVVGTVLCAAHLSLALLAPEEES